MFSIADIQNEQETEYEQEEGETNQEEEAMPPYPIRCSFSITKVCFFASLASVGCSFAVAVCYQWRTYD